MTTTRFDSPLSSILLRLRERDAQELAELGLTAERIEPFLLGIPAVEIGVWCGDSGPAAFMAFHQVTPRALNVSMLATDDWPQVARQVVRWSIDVRSRLLGKGFTRADCRTMAGHDDAIRMLEHFGFRRECTLRGYGASGVDFIQFAWSLGDQSDVPERAESLGTTSDSQA